MRWDIYYIFVHIGPSEMLAMPLQGERSGHNSFFSSYNKPPTTSYKIKLFLSKLA